MDRSCPWFVDWLSISEDHEGVPVVGQTEIIATDLATGCCDWVQLRGVSHRGSYSTSLLVRSDGRRVSVSGNPSRWGRPDNLFGFRDLVSCLALYNGVLRQLGLPGFTSSATISRIDLTCNHVTGSERNMLAAMRYLSGQRHRRSPTVYPDFRGVVFGRNASYSRLKFYDKATELRKRSKGDEYVKALADWCEAQGLVREEWTLGRKMLHEQGLTKVSEVSMAKLVELVEGRREIPRRLETSRVTMFEVAEALVERGVLKDRSAAFRLQGYVYAWASGADLRAELPRSTFYRVRRQLLSVGLDVAHPLDVARVTPKAETVAFTAAVPPEWYRGPVVPALEAA